MLTIEKVKKLLFQQIEKEKKSLEEHELLWEAIKKNKGNINKRIEKYLPKNCSFKKECWGVKHFEFSDSKNTHFYGESLLSIVNHIDSKEFFDKHNSPNFEGAKDRIRESEKMLKNIKILFNVFSEIETNFNKLKESVSNIKIKKVESFYNPIYYELLNEIGIDYKLINDIK